MLAVSQPKMWDKMQNSSNACSEHRVFNAIYCWVTIAHGFIQWKFIEYTASQSLISRTLISKLNN